MFNGSGEIGYRPGGEVMRRKLVMGSLGFAVTLCVVASSYAQSVDDSVIASMSAEEKIASAANSRRQISESASRISAMKEEAVQTEEDAIRVRCLNEASVSVNGFLAVAAQSYEQLQTAVSAGDTRAANHHLLMVNVSAQRAKGIEAQASQCLGGALRFVGDSQTTQQIDPRLAEYDPTAFRNDSGGAFIFVEELPPKASAER